MIWKDVEVFFVVLQFLKNNRPLDYRKVFAQKISIQSANLRTHLSE